MKRLFVIIMAAFGLVFATAIAAAASTVAPCVKSTVTAHYNGDNTVTASTSGPACTAQLSSWDATGVHQKLFDRVVVTVTEEAQTFSVKVPECGRYQIDFRTAKLPNGKFITGGFGSSNGEGCQPPPRHPSATDKVSCHGFSVHLRDYPKGTVVEIAIDHTAATATKLGQSGRYDFSIKWNSKKNHFYELSVTVPSWVESPKSWSVSGPVKACIVATPQPPETTEKKHTVAAPVPQLPRTGGFASNLLGLGLLLPFAGAGLYRAGRKRA